MSSTSTQKMSSFTFQEHQFMARAINIAQNGKYTVAPNPSVGCVIVKNGQVLSEGWHKKAGTGHAEVNAVKQLSEEQLLGATVYVTLEPCSHYGRTPPCAELLANTGIKEVIVAMLDPNPLVSGRGIRMLQDAGKQVRVGLLEQDAEKLNVGFLTKMNTKRPFVQVKLAASLDGKTALQNGQSKWITGGKARADVQRYRALSCAVLSSSRTLLADDASFNVRANDIHFNYPIDDVNEEIRQPKRLILDSSDLLTESHVNRLKVFSDEVKGGEVIVFKPLSSVNSLSKGQVVNLDTDGGFDLNQLLDWCGTNNINHLWVEAGGTLAASFIEQNKFDELIVYLAPKIMGANAMDLLPIGPFKEMSQTVDLQLIDTITVGNDIRFTYRKAKQEQ